VLLFLLLAAIQPAVEAAALAGGSTGAPRLLADDEYYQTLLTDIGKAETSIELIMFLWKPGRNEGDDRPGQIVRALGAARRRGVEVRVVLENSGYDQAINRNNQEAARLLQREGIATLFDSPSITTHAKLMVIDGRYCYIGSHNLTHSALARNHEMTVKIDDRRLAAELLTYAERITARPATPRPARREPGPAGPR